MGLSSSAGRLNGMQGRGLILTAFSEAERRQRNFGKNGDDVRAFRTGTALARPSADIDFHVPGLSQYRLIVPRVEMLLE